MLKFKYMEKDHAAMIPFERNSTPSFGADGQSSLRNLKSK
jgi:hypothetical protein